MSKAALTIWCELPYPEHALQRLREGVQGHNVVLRGHPAASTPAGASAQNPPFDAADVAFGQPDPELVLQSPKLKWVQLDSAGCTRYDRDDLRSALRARGAALTNASTVFDDPCAHHVLAMMLAFARRL